MHTININRPKTGLILEMDLDLDEIRQLVFANENRISDCTFSQTSIYFVVCDFLSANYAKTHIN